jgi:hypothetical protein
LSLEAWEETAYSVSTTMRSSTRRLTCNISPGRTVPGSHSTGGTIAVWWREPCAGGNCANGPNGTDTIVDVSNLSPDQQFQGGLFCGSVRATPTTPISPTGLCPAGLYGSTLLQIPSPGTQNDDHNPSRIAQRNLFDVAVGHDNLFERNKRSLSLRLTVINLTNQYSLYNFLSTFSGTHYVSPRTVTATVGYHF